MPRPSRRRAPSPPVSRTPARLLDHLRPHRGARRRVRRVRLGRRPTVDSTRSPPKRLKARRHHRTRPGGPRPRGKGIADRSSGPCARPSARPRRSRMIRGPARRPRTRPHRSAAFAASLAAPRRRRRVRDGIRTQQWALSAMHTQEAWRTTKGKGITVAVLDTGVEAATPTSSARSSPARTSSASGPAGATGPGPATAPPWPASSPVTAMARAARTASWASRPRRRSCPSA